MAKKAKEQVKYDPSLSSSERLGRAVNAFMGKKNTIFMSVLFVFIIYVNIILWLIAPFDKFDIYHEGGGKTLFLMLGFEVTAFAYSFALMGKVYTDASVIKKGHSNVNGASVISELLMTMPTDRLTVQKMDFRKFVHRFLIPVMIMLTMLNGYSLFLIEERSVIPGSDFSEARGMAGFMVLSVSVITIALFHIEHDVRGKGEKQAKTVRNISMVLMMGLIWVPILFELMPGVFELAGNSVFFYAFAGVPGLLTEAVVLLHIFVTEKRFLEPKLKNAPWLNE